MPQSVHATHLHRSLVARLALGVALAMLSGACSQSTENKPGGRSAGSGTNGAAASSQTGSPTGGSSQNTEESGGNPALGGQVSSGGDGPSGIAGAAAAGGGGEAGTGGATVTGGAGPTGGATVTGGAGPTGGAAATGGAGPTGGAAATGGSDNATGGTGAAATGGGQGVGDPAVHFIGRMDLSDAAGPRFAWSGSGVIARFSGTSVSVNLAGGQQYTVVIDGAVQSTLIPTSSTTSVAQGLSDGTHTVELYRRTEASQGESQFFGFDFGDGQLLAPPAPAARRLEIVGDSITCGYGNEGADQYCGFTPDTENHYLTYGAITARDLGAELITIAWSGKGVVCNYGDAADSCTNPLPTYYDRVLPERADIEWDFASFQPDAVVINLGTNDFSTDQDPSQAEFEDAYRSFLEHIRSKYPSAYLLCTNGPMLTDTDLSTVRGCIDNVVQALTSAGDTRVGSFEITPQDGADGYGCDWHPSLATHRNMADQLETALRTALGW